MRILWHSNAPWAPTGYGGQTKLFTKLLAEQHDVTISANYGLDAAGIVFDGISVLAGNMSDQGNGTIPGHVVHTFGNARNGLVITLYDTLVFDSALFAKLNVACWTPVDHDPVPPKVVSFLRGSSAIPIAMSRYGEEQLTEFDPLYVPHAFDENVHKPTPSDTREMLGIPEDGFLVTMIAANKGRPSRKSFVETLQAFGEIRKRHENAYIYLHTVLSPYWCEGEDIPTLMTALNIPEEAVKVPNQYRMIFQPPEPEAMAGILTASDVLINCATGEGFGVPIIEAQACGTPVIVTRHSAMHELCGAGWEVGGYPRWTNQASWMLVPDVGEMVDALEECYGLSDEERAAMRSKALEFAQGYRGRHVFDEYWVPALEEIQERLGDREPLSVAA